MDNPSAYGYNTFFFITLVRLKTTRYDHPDLVEINTKANAMTGQHRLAAVMFTDMEGYTALMQRDEALALQWRERHRRVMQETHSEFAGRIVQYFGDGTLSLFDSAIGAVRCAIAIQQQLAQAPRIPLRIGIHLGEVVLIDDDVAGSAVNIASRIESFSVSGAVLVSKTVVEQAGNQSDLAFKLLGEYAFKNVVEPMALFAVVSEGLVVPQATALAGKGSLASATTNHNLPVNLTSFIGRDRELSEVVDLIEDHRLITLTGPGGSGKTRLAIKVAEMLTADFTHGCHWIELAAVARPEQTAFAIAQALSLQQDVLNAIEDTLIRFLCDKHFLLVLDNFEQIVGAAPLVELLLTKVPTATPASYQPYRATTSG